MIALVKIKVKYKIEGYDIFKSKGDISRIITYCKSELKAKENLNICDNSIASTWLEIGHTRSRWLVGQFYREQSILGQPNSRKLDEQVERFNLFLNGIENLNGWDNCIILGDFNINLDLECTDDNNYMLRNLLFDTFPLAGFTQMVKKYTRL